MGRAPASDPRFGAWRSPGARAPRRGGVACRRPGGDAAGQEVKVQNAGLGCLLEEERGGSPAEPPSGVGEEALTLPTLPPSRAGGGEACKGGPHLLKSKPRKKEKGTKSPFTNCPQAARALEGAPEEEVAHNGTEQRGAAPRERPAPAPRARRAIPAPPRQRPGARRRPPCAGHSARGTAPGGSLPVRLDRKGTSLWSASQREWKAPG